MTAEPEQETFDDAFTTRAIMSLVTEAAEIREVASRLYIVVAALAENHGISTEI